MTQVAIVGATLIDGTGSTPIPNATILINGPIIESVHSSPIALDSSVEITDASGRYVTPGLIDANVHLLGTPHIDILLEHEGEFEALVLEAAQIALRSGVTTVFDTWGPVESLIAVRDRINSGGAIGSRMLVAGNIVGFGGPFSPDFQTVGDLLSPMVVSRINAQWESGVGADLTWLPAEEVRTRVREYLARFRVDFLKYAGSAHPNQYIAFSERSQRAIVQEARRAGLTVQAHTNSVESLRMEILAGANILQHPNVTGNQPIPRDTIDEIVARDLPVALLLWTEPFRFWLKDHFDGDELHACLHENAINLASAGANLLLTTDSCVVGARALSHPTWRGLDEAPDLSFKLGESHFQWLETAGDIGLSPMDALRAGTSNVARAYGQAEYFGTVEPGKFADLLILRADPLDDISNFREIDQVWKEGVRVERDTLPERPILSVAR